MKGPKLLHLHTHKGQGYKPAMENATVWHAPGKFCIESGERIIESQMFRNLLSFKMFLDKHCSNWRVKIHVLWGLRQPCLQVVP